ncbi:MAG: hypothetical protein CMJ83_07645 [Planctomycetes bacterium]|nr:hypothetical protein [Planctomycetota bacterium]
MSLDIGLKRSYILSRTRGSDQCEAASGYFSAIYGLCPFAGSTVPSTFASDPLFASTTRLHLSLRAREQRGPGACAQE